MTRRPYVLLCLLFLIPVFSAAAVAQSIKWKSVAPPGVAATEYLTDDLVITPNGRLYAVAYLLDLNKNSILLTSTDRGASWSVRPIGANPSGMWLYDLAFTSDQVGYVAGFSDGCGSCPVILKTTDGGDSWNPTTFAGNGAINSIDFLDAQKGFAVGGPGLLKTTDAGASWKPIESAAIDAVAPSQVTFATATVGYVSAIPQGGQGWPTVLLKTTDGGATWATIQDNGTNVNALAFRELHFFGPDTGVTVGRINSKPMVFRTVDGGATWTNQYTPDVTMSSPYKALHAVHFLDKKIGIATGDYGLILRTSDGGITWKREASSIDGSNDFNAALVFSEQEAAVGGAHGMLLNREATFLPTAVTSSTGLDFGTVTSGAKEMSLTISAGNEAGVTINTLQIQDGSGGPKGFTLVAPTTAAPYNLTPSTPLTVTVRYTPKSGATGNIVSTLHLTTNDAARQQINLPLRAKGSSQTASATLSASQLEFGEVGPGTPAERTVSITASGGAPLQVKGIRVESLTGQEGFTAAAERTLPTSLAPGDSLKITVKFMPEDFEAPTQAMLSVETNAADTAHTVFLQGQGVQPAASVSSSSLDFGTVDQGREQTRSFSIAAGNGAGVRVDTLYFQSDGGGAAAEFSIVEPISGFPIQIQKGTPLNVAVRFRPGARNGAIAAALFAKTNLPAASLLKISLAAVANLSTSSVQDFPMAANSISIAASPSPVAKTGMLRLSLPEAGNVRVVIYDLLGRPAADLFNGLMEAGTTQLPIDLTALANGRYFCIAEGDGMRGVVEIQIER